MISIKLSLFTHIHTVYSSGFVLSSYLHVNVVQVLVPRVGLQEHIRCTKGHAVAQLVEALHYKPEGRGFDS